MFKFILLLQSDKPKVICKLGAFLKNVLPLFRPFFSTCCNFVCCIAAGEVAYSGFISFFSLVPAAENEVHESSESEPKH